MHHYVVIGLSLPGEGKGVLYGQLGLTHWLCVEKTGLNHGQFGRTGWLCEEKDWLDQLNHGQLGLTHWRCVEKDWNNHGQLVIGLAYLLCLEKTGFTTNVLDNI